MMLRQTLFSVLALVRFGSAVNLTVAASGGNVTSPLMYGLMFEDINHSGDGGVYAELIPNRAFQGSIEYPSIISPWSAVGNAVLTLQNTSIPLSSALPTSINVSPDTSGGTSEQIGILNPGWWGIDVQPQLYTGSFWTLGSYNGTFTVKLQSNLTSQVFASVDVPSASEAGTWIEHTYTLEPTSAAPNVNNTLVLEFDSGGVGQGGLNLNLISLFPPTYKNRPNGNRADLMSAMEGLNPSFLRMPGGNNIEGDSYHYPWRWNETIGPLTQRPGRPGTWGYENTDGLGLVEYLNWCTDLEVEPILAVWSGLYLVNDDYLSAAALAPWVNDTLNELEFILGDASTYYGAIRASLGYPEPWNLKYVEIGNEDQLYGGAGSYASYRFSMFYNAISAKYPSLTLISSSGDLTAVGPGSATDFHIYTRPDDFVSEFSHFDNVDRSHKVLVGEYANVQYNLYGQNSGVNWSAPKLEFPMWAGAVSEAIWSIGVERNGDVTLGMSYAPGFQNMDSYSWSPDLISFTADPAQTLPSTSYRVVELFSNSRYNATVPVTSDSDFGPAYWVAGVSAPGKYTFKTAIYNATETVPFDIQFEGVASGASATLTVLTAPDGLSSNTLENGAVTEVVQKTVKTLSAGAQGDFTFELENYSIAVLTT